MVDPVAKIVSLELTAAEAAALAAALKGDGGPEQALREALHQWLAARGHPVAGDAGYLRPESLDAENDG